MSFEIFTDSSASLSTEMIEKYHLHILSLTCQEKGVPGEYKSFDNGRPIDTTIFYRRMRDENAVFITSCVNTAAALGQGLLVVLAARQREQGATIEETHKWVEENKLRLCHWFTVENLKYLRRGGRISATSAVMGNLLDIKPVLHVDDAGKRIAMTKVRGVRAAVKEMFERMKATAVRDPDSPVFINHADILERAEELAARIRAEFGTKEIYIDSLDLVIGAHSGPGTLALFFVGDHR